MPRGRDRIFFEEGTDIAPRYRGTSGLPLFSPELMYNIFDAPALRDLEHKFRAIAMGADPDQIFAEGSPAAQTYEKYIGAPYEPSQTISTPEQYDPNLGIIQPGTSYQAPSIFPGGVGPWASQQIVKGQQLPENIAAATGLLRNQYSSAALAPGMTAVIAQLRNQPALLREFEASKKRIQIGRPGASEAEIMAAAKWEFNQLHPGTFKDAPTEAPELGQSLAQYRELQNKERVLIQEQGKGERLDKSLALQKNLKEQSINLQRQISQTKDDRKREELQLRQQEIDDKRSQNKIKNYVSLVRAFEAAGLANAHDLAVHISENGSAEGLDIPPETRAAMNAAMANRLALGSSLINYRAQSLVNQSRGLDIRTAHELASIEDHTEKLKRLSQTDQATKNAIAEARVIVSAAQASTAMGRKGEAHQAIRTVWKKLGLPEAEKTTIESMMSTLMQLFGGEGTQPRITAPQSITAPQDTGGTSYVPSPEGLNLGPRTGITAPNVTNPSLFQAPRDILTRPPSPGPVKPGPGIKRPMEAPPTTHEQWKKLYVP